MALDIPNNKELFGQGDVRETAIATTGTSFWSCTGSNFKTSAPATQVADYEEGKCVNGGTSQFLVAPVFLPNGAIVTEVIGFGNAAAEAETISLGRYSQNGTASNLSAQTAFNTAQTTITNATINNSTHGYFFSTSTLDTNDEIFGARITYTI